MKKPYFDQIKLLCQLRREKRTMDKILRAYNTLHNKEYEDSYQRNLATIEMLKDVEIIQPEVKKAIEEEKEIFLKLIEEMAIFYLEETGNPIRHLEIGGWWYELFDRPNKLFITSGEVQIEPTNDYKESTHYWHGEGNVTTVTNDKIRVTLMNEKTFQESLEEHRKRHGGKL